MYKYSFLSHREQNPWRRSLLWETYWTDTHTHTHTHTHCVGKLKKFLS